MYGRVLLVKLALVAGLVGQAALNRLRLTPALRRGDPDAPRRLGWSIVGEVGLVIGILIATATLGTTPPPRALLPDGTTEAQDAHAHQEHGHMPTEQRLSHMATNFMAEVTLAPGRIGINDVAIAVTNHIGQPLDVAKVMLRLSNPEKGIAPL
ncbi:putative Copper export protein [Rubellimicrobium mesophilum DSM 19309]|uniref:Putative Copper export protein n=1 Tax=Rubellimicrobium mesophilum DSM 19309 TaxID=442562 RepID=A0A017HT64_9RHOB|nr:CopD family protein [Rubellimicrobium mesophilum]EYD77510.1 putative Copper export protein [Rubellimicrobium mesophilum DSM 19309]